jgi:hypothetical protein
VATLGEALRKKFKNPRDALKALGLDEALLKNSTTEKSTMSKPTRLAALTLGLTTAAIAPLLAMDSKVTLPKNLFNNFTTKNFAESKAKLLAGARIAIDGKLRKGLALDASMEGLAKAIDTFADMPEAMNTPLEETPAKKMEMDAEVMPVKEEPDKGTYDAEPFKAFLKEKGMGDEDIQKACDMAMPKNALDEDMDADDEETPEKKAEREAAEKKAADEKADLEGKIAAKDAEIKEMVKKPAMDAAIASAEKRVRETERGIRVALQTVKPYVGELPDTLAFDSANDVLRHALTMMKVPNAKTMHADALNDVVASKPKAGAKAPITGDGEGGMALDSAGKSFSERHPDVARIQQI